MSIVCFRCLFMHSLVSSLSYCPSCFYPISVLFLGSSWSRSCFIIPQQQLLSSCCDTLWSNQAEYYRQEDQTMEQAQNHQQEKHYEEDLESNRVHVK